jgi:hypothetical protein
LVDLTALWHAHVAHTDTAAHTGYTHTLLLLVMSHLRHLYLVISHPLARDGGGLGFVRVDAD